MRNDARPVGHDAPGDPAGAPDHASDARASVTDDRPSHIVNRRAADDRRRDDVDADPALPAGDATLKTKI
jgi:hypothetical protein